MTDWHCPRCHRHVRIYRHSTGVPCAACERLMRRGMGRGTTHDRHFEVLAAARQHAEQEAGRRR